VPCIATPGPDSQPVKVMLPPDLFAELCEEARSRETSLSGLTRLFIKDRLRAIREEKSNVAKHVPKRGAR